MKTGVVIFPGSNCDRDTLYVVENILGHEAIPLWHKETDLKGSEFIILPGGFSYGDYLRSGSIASLSPIMEEVGRFAKNGGPVLGICNGFQVLCEAELLPGALLHNDHQKFSCKNTHLRVVNENTLFTRGLDKDKAHCFPIAHAEGKFYAPADQLKKVWENGQVIFQYSNSLGEVTSEANPNGSLDNIAGVCNEEGNVFGMMPHPERASDPVLGNTDGQELFKSFYEKALV